MSAFQHSSILPLPKEIRLIIYDYIARSILEPGLPPTDLHDYQGLILSSKQIYWEFEAQYLRNLHVVLQNLRSAWTLEPTIRMFTPNDLSETTSMHIYMPNFAFDGKSPPSSELDHFFTTLVHHLPACTLVPDPEEFKNKDAKMKCLEKIQKVVWRCTKPVQHMSLGEKPGWTPECLSVVLPKHSQDHGRVRTCRLFLRLEAKPRISRIRDESDVPTQQTQDQC